MLNRLRSFMSKPRSLRPEYRVVGEELLNIIAQLRKDIADLKNRPVQTIYEGDHERIKTLEDCIDAQDDKLAEIQLGQIPSITNRLKKLEHANIDIIIRIERLEEQFFKTLSSRISSASWQRPRHKDGRFAKRNGAGDAKSA